MGNLEPTPFYNAVKRGGKNKEEALHIALNKCALWAEHISDPSWRPFKAVAVDGESVVHFLIISNSFDWIWCNFYDVFRR